MRSFFGYCEFFFESKSAIVLINEFRKRKLYLSCRKTAEGLFRVRCPVFSADGVQDAASACAVLLLRREEHGLMTAARRLIRRPGLLAGIVMAALMVSIAPAFLWKVTVTGNANVSSREILTVLRQAGIDEGVYIPNLRLREAKAYLLQNLHSVSSIGFTRHGCFLICDVLERVSVPPAADKSGIFNVCAAQDGIILSVTATEGKPAVAAGDVVTAGEILINGVYTGQYETLIARHAAGIVMASVRENYLISVPLDYPVVRETGRIAARTEILLPGGRISLWAGHEVPFKSFRAETEEERLFLLGTLELPAVRQRAVFYETETVLTVLTVAEAAEKAKSAFLATCGDAEGGLLYTEYDLVYDEKARVVTLRGSADFARNIAVEKPCEIISSPDSEAP